jgi:hypothetical protein
MQFLGLGDDRPIRDLKLTDLMVEDVVFLNDIVYFEAKLSGSGFAGREVRVVLRQKDKPGVLAEQKLKVAPDGQSQQVRLPYRPTEEGEFRYTVEVEPLDTQAAYYEQALALAFCQPNVEAMLLFLAQDERARSAWQSGLYYVDGTPKSSRPRVTRALDRTAGGSITRCSGVQLIVHPSYLRFGTRSAARRGVFRTMCQRGSSGSQQP